jgi:AcrR family transcriptional regulator
MSAGTAEGTDRAAATGPAWTSKAPDERRGEIVAAARTVFGRRGFARTTFKDVADEVGVTRGLIYHYFADKDALVDVVLEQVVDEFVVSVRVWDAQRVPGDIDRALLECIALFRRHLDPADPLRQDLHRVENAALYSRFIDRAVDAVVDCIRETTVRAYARRHHIEIEHVGETFTVLVHGLIGLTRSHPDIEDDVLARVVRQVLHLERSSPGGDPAHVEGD